VELITPRLLITDDDPDLRSTLRLVLQRRGFSTELASDGFEGLEIIRQTEIHLVVLDVHMPRLTGLEMLAQLSRERPELPCILMSGKLDDSIRGEAKRMRVVSILEKPIHISHLSEAVNEALRAKYGWVA
jgi:two-component system chemotaxis response regulator CheY